MKGFLPTKMWQKQHDNQVDLGSKKQGITLGTIFLCDKLIEVTHSLWTKRNSFKHDRKLHELRELEDSILKSAIKIHIN